MIHSSGQVMSKIKKLLKALSGTISWSLKAPRIKRELANKNKKPEDHSSNFKKGFTGA